MAEVLTLPAYRRMRCLSECRPAGSPRIGHAGLMSCTCAKGRCEGSSPRTKWLKWPLRDRC